MTGFFPLPVRGREEAVYLRPKTSLIEKALESYLAEYADYQVALDRLRDKDDPVISSAEMRKRIARRKS